ncbi:YwdI family protein [Planococcus shenhongbingii]|uniref:YwdI family protein n=1 Tax=Planococcus shenhongbingii TaxID=3058398 RepID=A0ABT8NA93_9BACL|nr:YwdI family protein [Planococcus sp. N017]MDN7244812.1 YwdI family protein [Planococcus sp. N017]
MAIDAARILNEIEKHTAQARKGDPAKMRESIAAVRALCDLLLENDQLQKDSTPRAIPLASPQIQPVSSASKLQEEDGANGDSLFEF